MMKQDNVIASKSYAFGLRIIKLYLHLKSNKVDLALCSQILRCGTSVGANVEEAIGGSSKKDFKHKLEISYREARETKYWLRLLNDSEILDNKLALSLIIECDELLKILTAILNTVKEKED